MSKGDFAGASRFSGGRNWAGGEYGSEIGGTSYDAPEGPAPHGEFNDASFGSIWDVISDAADSVLSVVHVVPGVDWLGDRLKDFANTTAGSVVLRALSTQLTAGLVPYIGPQMASVAFAVPSLAKGDNFAKAWVSETIWRIKTTAEILASMAGDSVSKTIEKYSQGLSDQLDKVTGTIGKKLESAGVDAANQTKVKEWVASQGDQVVQNLAKEAGVREDMAMASIDGYTGQLSFGSGVPQQQGESNQDFAARTLAEAVMRHSPPGFFFDPITGKKFAKAYAKKLTNVQAAMFFPKFAKAPEGIVVLSPGQVAFVKTLVGQLQGDDPTYFDPVTWEIFRTPVIGGQSFTDVVAQQMAMFQQNAVDAAMLQVRQSAIVDGPSDAQIAAFLSTEAAENAQGTAAWKAFEASGDAKLLAGPRPVGAMALVWDAAKKRADALNLKLHPAYSRAQYVSRYVGS